MNRNLTLWINCFLTGRKQFVRFKDTLSSTITINTGAPQGCILSPVLFTLYTSDFQICSENCFIVKYADDTVVVGLVNRSSEFSDTKNYMGEIDNFSDWCGQNYLNLNVKKTKELIVDFGRIVSKKAPVVINDEDVEKVHQYKYLGTIIDDKLHGILNVNRVYRKASQHLFFLRKLKNVNINVTILNLFYKSVVQSVINFCIICWFGGLTKKDKMLIDRIVRRARKIGCTDVCDAEELFSNNVIKKIQAILEVEDHPLYRYYHLLPSGNRLTSLYCRTNRFKNTFVPTSIRKYNKSSL